MDPAPRAAETAPPHGTGADVGGLSDVAAFRRRYGWITRLRPQNLALAALGAFVPGERRRIVAVGGLRLFLDPLTYLVAELLEKGEYEPATMAAFRANIAPGSKVLDIGANEGFFSALAATLVGPEGLVVAMEPRSRLRDVLEINLKLNARCRTVILAAAAGERPGENISLSLAPATNSGASSIVNRYRWGNAAEAAPSMTGADILQASGVERFDFVKIDVEGFEGAVVRGLAPLLREGRLGTVLLDYHLPMLQAAGEDPAKIEAVLLDAGYVAAEKEHETPYRGYVLYRRA